MYYLYILKSGKDNKLYIGSTSDLKKRLKEHNGGKVCSTKSRTPLSLVYYEAYLAEYDARYREKMLKWRGQARAKLLSRISKSIS